MRQVLDLSAVVLTDPLHLFVIDRTGSIEPWMAVLVFRSVGSLGERDLRDCFRHDRAHHTGSTSDF